MMGGVWVLLNSCAEIGQQLPVVTSEELLLWIAFPSVDEVRGDNGE